MQKIKILGVTISGLALSLFAGTAFISYNQAFASTNNPNSVVGSGEFNQDVAAGIQQVNNDKDAQNLQQEVDDQDNKLAGDEDADVDEIDGENNQDEIDTEIELDQPENSGDDVQTQTDVKAGIDGASNNDSHVDKND